MLLFGEITILNKTFSKSPQKYVFMEFPDGPVVRTQHFHCCDIGSIPGEGTKIPQATQHNQK